jgi:hypothetical protein
MCEKYRKDALEANKEVQKLRSELMEFKRLKMEESSLFLH